MNKTDRLNMRYDLVKFALKYGNKPASREFKTSVKVVRKWVNSNRSHTKCCFTTSVKTVINKFLSQMSHSWYLFLRNRS